MLHDSSCQVWFDEFCLKYFNIFFSNLVVKCSEGVTEATSDTLSSVMECGKEATIDWVKKNARYQEIVKHLSYTFFIVRKLLKRLETFLMKKRMKMKILKAKATEPNYRTDHCFARETELNLTIYP